LEGRKKNEKDIENKILSAVLIGLAIAGCGIAAKQITLKSQSERTSVFTEVQAGEPIPKGFADLIIRADIKTHLEEYYFLESKESIHGKQGYPFLLNINGQAVVWKVAGIKESKPKHDKDGKRSLHPEAGDGMRRF
jgi:hypothetical protein